MTESVNEMLRDMKPQHNDDQWLKKVKIQYHPVSQALPINLTLDDLEGTKVSAVQQP